MLSPRPRGHIHGGIATWICEARGVLATRDVMAWTSANIILANHWALD
jgi:hypothetical protein